jgi:hypothetical protein
MAAAFRLLQLDGRRLVHRTTYASASFSSSRIVDREAAGVVACLDAARTSEAISNKELPGTDDEGEGGYALKVAYIFVSSNNMSRAVVRYMSVPSADDAAACKRALKLADRRVCVNRELAWFDGKPLEASVAVTIPVAATYNGAAAGAPSPRTCGSCLGAAHRRRAPFSSCRRLNVAS